MTTDTINVTLEIDTSKIENDFQNFIREADEKQKRFNYIIDEMYLEYQMLEFTQDEISEFTHFLVVQTLETVYTVDGIVYLARQMFYAWRSKQSQKNIDRMKEYFRYLLKNGDDSILLLAMKMQSLA